MKMKIRKRSWLPLVLPSTLVISPIFVSSCISLPSGDISRPEQIELLSSEQAKNTLMDNWLTTTFTSLYAESIANVSDNSTTIAEIRNSLEYYLLNLSWPDTTQTDSNSTIKYATIEQSKKTEFENSIKDAYKFYISYRSTIVDSSEDGAPQPIVYFMNKANTWKSNELNTIIPIYKDQNKNSLLTIQNFNPGIKYTGVDSNNSVIEQDFKILMSTRGTLVYQNVLKLLLGEMYFLKSTERLIKNGTNYNKMTRNMSSVDYINTQAYVGQKNGQNDFSTFMLKKYTVENSPQLLWSYAAEDYTTSTTVSSIVSSISDFNNLSITKDTQLSNILAPASSESNNNDISKLQAFKETQINANSDSEGDLSSNIDTLKMYGDTKIGLLDTTSNMLFTFTELDAIKEIRKYNANSQNSANLLSIPSITIKSGSASKKSHSITIDDLQIVWDGTEITHTNNVFTKTFTSTSSNNVTQELKINSISYLPSNGEEKDINISFTYSFTNGSNTKNSFDYNFSISNWGENDSSQINPFMNQYQFSGSESQVGIKIFDNATSTGISYYLRVLPIWKSEQSISINGSNWYSKGYWTFENTPWNTEELQKKLVHFFVMLDTNLFTNIQNFYLFNNYDIEGNSYELSSLISSLGLTKKTDDDRRAEGIIY